MSWYQDGHGYGPVRRRRKRRWRTHGGGAPYQQLGTTRRPAVPVRHTAMRPVQAEPVKYVMPSLRQAVDMFNEPDVPSSRRHSAMDLGSGAEVQHVRREGPTPIEDAPVQGADVPMTQLHATPAAAPAPAQQMTDFSETGQGDPGASFPQPARPAMPSVQMHSMPPTPAMPSAQMNVAAHRQRGLLTVNQQSRFDSSALHAEQPRGPGRGTPLAGPAPPEQPGYGPYVPKKTVVRRGDPYSIERQPRPARRPEEDLPPMQSGVTSDARHAVLQARTERLAAAANLAEFRRIAELNRLPMPGQPPRQPPRQPPQPPRRDMSAALALRSRRRAALAAADIPPVQSGVTTPARDAFLRSKIEPMDVDSPKKEPAPSPKKPPAWTSPSKPPKQPKLPPKMVARRSSASYAYAKPKVRWDPKVVVGPPRAEAERVHGRTVAAIRRANTELIARIGRGGRDLSARDTEIARLNIEGRRLESEARGRVGRLKGKLAEARRPKPAPVAPAAPAAAPAAGPIITVSAPGGGGASSSSAGGAAAGSGPAAAAPDLSKVVEAVQKIAEAAVAAKKTPAKGTAGKGVTQARRRYTDKRKTTLAALRALKSKRIREFDAKTKKLPKAERDKQRREFKKKVNAQYKEVTTKFPTARGMKSAGTIRDLIKKLEGIKTGR